MTPSLDDIDKDDTSTEKRKSSTLFKDWKSKIISKMQSNLPFQSNGENVLRLHPEQAKHNFFYNTENMKYHMDMFFHQEDFEEKWKDVLTHIKNSDIDAKKKRTIKNKIKEVLM